MHRNRSCSECEARPRSTGCKVGELTADKLPVIVLDHPVLTALEDVTGRQIDGIMGFTFFARFKTTIDYHAREMTFEPINYQVRDLLKELPDRLMGPKVAAAARGGTLRDCGDCVWVSRPTGSNRRAWPIVKVLDGSPASRAGLKVR